ncbi:MAG TPA: flagellar hook capping FlgD N-terminal domain-containing protein [Candidatus Saccharimonadales bacterium]|jgi:flagellar basal-body rod modification protein FlgD|nr:flagellar hook capping FlgD N-terminal domain-containing protein [Candidatus Saccharimonadales bacterium]
MATSIDPTSAVPWYGEQTGTEARLPTQTLDQNDFLKLLVAQMTSQDPLNPKSDIEMIPQMVQFTTLEQSKAMQADIAHLRADQQLLQANALIGRTVQLQVGNQAAVSGQVTAVQLEEGTPKLVVNGHTYDLSTVLGITPAAAP